ncbi:acyl-homoserine-lactone acylase [Pseudoduganella flava]|nr:penicillin acylase family protein [Pseudoduganella flava]TWI39935.1 acyl-homoserine-lactone acylase [Pseudoduganella flava]
MRIILLVLLSCLLLAGCSDDAGPRQAPVTLSADITRTSYGVAHIRANDFAGLGFGLAYAYAQDNVCMLADSFLTVRGERSRYFGGEAMATAGTAGEYSVLVDYLNLHNFALRNEDSDFFFKAYLDPARLRASYQSASAEATALLAGYAAGYNRYLRERGGDLPAACRGVPWVKPISVEDVYLLIAEKALHASGELFAREIVAAARDAPGSPAPIQASLAKWTNEGLGSNAIALGGDATVDGRGMLLANPHFPWFSSDRFYQVHLTIPGTYDVMGASLGGLPIVVIGFNKDVAWTHTVTTAAHFTTFRLPLDKRDPSGGTYLIDGQPLRMTERAVDVDLLQQDGTLRTKRRVFRESGLGMQMAMPGIPLGPDDILVLADPNRDNTRLIDQWIAMGKSDSVQALQASLARVMGLPWVNTVAADRHGNTLFADYSVVPHVSPAKFASDCLLFAPLLMLDGARTSCHWGRDPNAPAGIFSDASAPAMARRDYVANSNDSYWLTNSRQLLTGPPPYGYSPLYGAVGVPQHLRTRLGFLQLDERLAQRGRLDIVDLAELLFSNRVHAAELVLPDLLAACRGVTDATTVAACAVLGGWDRKVDLQSRGAILFREFWLHASALPDKWAIPFDPGDPVRTPRGVAAQAVAPMLVMLKEAAQRLLAFGIGLDAPLGQFQSETRNGQRYPMHGGIGDVDGVYNALHMKTGLSERGYENVAWGTSYIQLVRFDEAGPVAHGLLAYSQSTDPTSPYYADQLPLYSAKALVLLPFTDDQIAADGNYRRMTVSND